MTRNLLDGFKRLAAGQISMRVLYVLVSAVVVLFGCFFFIGYDEPFADNPSFNAPVLTDAVLIFIYVLVGLSVVAALVSVAFSFKKRDKSAAVVNNIPALKISRSVAIFLLLCMVATYVAGSSEAVVVNGVRYTDVFWLKLTDMFISTSFILLFVAVCGVIFGMSGYNRKIKLRRKG